MKSELSHKWPHESFWDHRFIELAKHVSTWSKDPRKKIGAVAVDPKEKRVLSTGYNGFPKWIRDDDRLNNRNLKSKYVIHAEMNCIYNASYTGVPLRDSHLYVHGLPVCHECAKGIIQVGIINVFCNYETTHEDVRWEESFAFTQAMFMEAGVGLWII